MNMSELFRRIIISGSIREDTASQFLEQITALECMDVTKPISVYIDTYGGSLDAAITIYDAMKSCCCPINTIGIGKVMSAGVLLLAAGDKGSRFITDNTRVMIHEVSAGAIGSVSEMEASLEEIRHQQEKYIELLSKNCGAKKDELLEDMQCETFMSAAEAVKYGIADRIVPIRQHTQKTYPKQKKKVSAKKTKK